MPQPGAGSHENCTGASLAPTAACSAASTSCRRALCCSQLAARLKMGCTRPVGQTAALRRRDRIRLCLLSLFAWPGYNAVRHGLILKQIACSCSLSCICVLRRSGAEGEGPVQVEDSTELQEHIQAQTTP